MIFAIVLAAGGSTRMGRPKQLLPLLGSTMLSAVVSRLLAAPVDRVVVVLGHAAEAIRSEAGLPADPRVEIVENEGWTEGMASSLRRGLEACRAAEAVVIALGDQPGIDPLLVAKLVSAGHAGARIALPVAGDRPDHPVLFHHELWPELLALRGDIGGREVVKRHWADAVRIAAEPTPDVDTPEDLQKLLAQARSAREGANGSPTHTAGRTRPRN